MPRFAAAVAAAVVAVVVVAALIVTREESDLGVLRQAVTSPSPLRSLSSNRVTDWFLFTWRRRRGSREAAICGLGSCVKFTSADNVLIAMALHVACYSYSVFRPYESFRYFYIHPSRPYTYVLSQFHMPNLYGLVAVLFMLAEVGESVVRHHSQFLGLFWILYILIPLLASTMVSKVVLFNGGGRGGDGARIGGGRGGMLALTAFATQSLPKSKYLIYGQIPVSGFGLLALQCCWILLESPARETLAEIALIQALSLGLFQVILSPHQ
ncbi:hypothetical protein BASA81_003105 [Batrachochytrium salamandrivorans]|nr:hypothetical protein BASA81_003105 [Batrachochytrium salamandrivorans]